jgi:hypothetical protein
VFDRVRVKYIWQDIRNAHLLDGLPCSVPLRPGHLVVPGHVLRVVDLRRGPVVMGAAETLSSSLFIEMGSGGSGRVGEWGASSVGLSASCWE